MPYQWVDPEVFFEYKGITIYHCYRHDMLADPYDYHFTSRLENSYEFDVRDFANAAQIPLGDMNASDWKIEVIKHAIDHGLFIKGEPNE